MSRVCAITGKTVHFGNNVSHANNKNRRRWQPNLQHASLPSDLLGRAVKLRVTVNGLKTIEHRGGIDAYLLSAKGAELTAEIRKLKKQVTAAKDRKAA